MSIQDYHLNFVNTMRKSPTDIEAQITTKKLEMLHAAIGIVGEVAELLELSHGRVDKTAILLELGDVEFYINELRNALELPFSVRDPHFTTATEVVEMSIFAGLLLDEVKKSALCDKVLDLTQIDQYVSYIQYYVCRVESQHGYSRREVLERNIEKIRARYPEGNYSDKAAFEKVDAIVAPTTPEVAFKIGEKTQDPIKMYLSDVLTIPCNIAGLPGISVPCGFSKDGLPIGIQVLGKPFDEETVIHVAYAYENNTNWRDKQPEV